jgi:hypothetical protein
MNLDFEENTTHVELSERNLRDLLAQYELQGDCSMGRLTTRGYLIVTVRPNDVHYLDRAPGAGSGLVA